jgi:AGCS family alanine or glycine:cation symporter
MLRVENRLWSLLLVALLAVGSMSAQSAQAQDEAPPTGSAAGESKEDEASKTASAESDSKPAEEKVDGGEKKEEGGVQAAVNDAFGKVNKTLASVMFYKVGGHVQLAVLWLIVGAVFFTIRMGFINFRGFKHAILVTAGKYDSKNSDEKGEVSHFQALTAALSATVGLGNIAGVAIAVAMGGPGATFWMIAAGLLGMSSKFVECTLGQKYREVRPDGRVMGGAMFYLSKGLAEMGLSGFGKFLAVFFAVLCIGGSFGGGCAFQVNQSLTAVAETVPILKDNSWIYGLVMTIAVGVVIIGGIRSIARVAEKIVPLMCGIYVVAAIAILVMNFDKVPSAISAIIGGAFTPEAGYGGLIGVLVLGFKRAAFSNEAGVGSAAIAHSAAKTEYPVREGIVALLEPFIDTVVICTMTALVIVIAGAYPSEFKKDEKGKDVPTQLVAHADEDVERADAMLVAVKKDRGATLTSLAMDGQIPGFRYILAVAVMLFAYSTMISWSYYGERCWAYLFGDNSSMVYRVIFLAFVFLGSIVSATNVLEFGDLMILGMAFPNIIGLLMLSGGVSRDLKAYWQKYTSGEFKRTDE